MDGQHKHEERSLRLQRLRANDLTYELRRRDAERAWGEDHVREYASAGATQVAFTQRVTAHKMSTTRMHKRVLDQIARNVCLRKVLQDHIDHSNEVMGERDAARDRWNTYAELHGVEGDIAVLQKSLEEVRRKILLSRDAQLRLCAELREVRRHVKAHEKPSN